MANRTRLSFGSFLVWIRQLFSRLKSELRFFFRGWKDGKMRRVSGENPFLWKNLRKTYNRNSITFSKPNFDSALIKVIKIGSSAVLIYVFKPAEKTYSRTDLLKKQVRKILVWRWPLGTLGCLYKTGAAQCRVILSWSDKYPSSGKLSWYYSLFA